MDAELDLPLPGARTRGRATKDSRVTFCRELTQEDIAKLSTERGIKPPAIKRLRDSHHAVAKALALDYTCAEVSDLTGYSPSRISILQADPAFQELQAFYRGRNSDEFVEAKAGLDRAMLDAALDYTSLIQERIDTDPDAIPLGAALDVVKTFADRVGYGPASKSTNLNVNLDMGEQLRTMRERTAAFDSGALPVRRLAPPGPVASAAETPEGPEAGASPPAQPLPMHPNSLDDPPKGVVGFESLPDAPSSSPVAPVLAKGPGPTGPLTWDRPIVEHIPLEANAVRRGANPEDSR